VDIARQREILLERRGLSLEEQPKGDKFGKALLPVLQVEGPPISSGYRTPAFVAWSWDRRPAPLDVLVYFPRRPWLRPRRFHNFVAAVTYANEVMRLDAAKEQT